MPWSNQTGGGGPWGSGSRGPWGSGPQPSGGGSRPPDLEEFLRRSQDRLRNVMPGNLGGRGIALIALVALALWAFSGFYTVGPDEVGVVLRFGKFVPPEVQPGLNYHLPYPIETVLTPPALRVNKTDVGIRPQEEFGRRGAPARDLPEESLMLTGDQNIIDVEFSVLWRIKPGSVSDYLFNVQNPEGTVKAVAESAMREVIGRLNVQPLLTGGSKVLQDKTETSVPDLVQTLMQKNLDSYNAGILIQNVQISRINPPAEVMDSFLDVQAARSDSERAQNEAQTYANRVVPEARGRAAKVLQDADAYREQAVAEAKGETSRFLQIYEQYKKAPSVTRERMYLETMERILSDTNKTIIDTGRSGPGVVPYLPLTELPVPPSRTSTPPRAGTSSTGGAQ
jgi:modulator of FtsH protease HflK